MDVELSAQDLEELETLNSLRRAGGSAPRGRLEARWHQRFGAGHRLAVYGSLAPGRSNYHQVEGLEGEWISGLTVRGELRRAGWGSAIGYPALRYSLTGAHVPVQLLVSTRLLRHWSRLDRFEGTDYRRILVPLFRGGKIAAVANLYETRAD